MIIFIKRDFQRTVGDDFKINVYHRIGDKQIATPMFDSKNQTLGWSIKNRFE